MFKFTVMVMEKLSQMPIGSVKKMNCHVDEPWNVCLATIGKSWGENLLKKDISANCCWCQAEFILISRWNSRMVVSKSPSLEQSCHSSGWKIGILKNKNRRFEWCEIVGQICVTWRFWLLFKISLYTGLIALALKVSKNSWMPVQIFVPCTLYNVTL